jgi:exodeoxyribonuclease VII large subunit
MQKNPEYTLSNLMDELNLIIRSSFDQSYWIVAELANVSTSPRGHMYMELVEKSGAQIIAKARANLWSSKRQQIISAFEGITRQTLKTGMKIMLQVTVDFHSVYGISLQVHDINPAYSLGELERQRQETIKKLEAEGLLNFNKQYILNPVIQNLAIISSETAAGYQDFMNQLENNTQSYTFKTKLYPAVMQGEQAVASIIKALDALENSQEDYSAIIIIRGGGSNLDLACFDDYHLNARLAQSYFPVLSGIGHERDQSVTDMVAHTRLKTPTAVAEFIIQHNHQFELQLENLFGDIIEDAKSLLNEQQYFIENNSRLIAENSRRVIVNEESVLKNSSFYINKSAIELINTSQLFLREQRADLSYSFRGIKDKNNFLLQNSFQQLKATINSFNEKKSNQINDINHQLKSTSLIIDKQKDKLDYLQNTIKLSNPELILKKGFSITRKNGQAISEITSLKEDDILETQLYTGSVNSKIIKKKI